MPSGESADRSGPLLIVNPLLYLVMMMVAFCGEPAAPLLLSAAVVCAFSLTWSQMLDAPELALSGGGATTESPEPPLMGFKSI